MSCADVSPYIRVAHEGDEADVRVHLVLLARNYERLLLASRAQGVILPEEIPPPEVIRQVARELTKAGP